MLDVYVVSLSGLALTLLLMMMFSRKQPLSKLSGPRGVPILGNILQLRKSQPHICLADWAKRYGGVMLIWLLRKPIVVVSSPQYIQSVLVSQGSAFANRPRSFHWDHFSENQSGVAMTNCCPELKGRRKLMQRYLRQYGSGLNRIEEVTNTAIGDMMRSLQVEH